ncbi:MAG: LysR family transcriptional regulator [Burkholderiales bacterium]|nr:LysR family transcriptional regulator [Burkholderiales bacterium]
MILTLEALAVLDAIDRHGSFAKAAQALARVPSALTYQVRKLEDELDVLLFDRRGHRARLTPAGADLLAQGRHLLDAAAAVEARVRRFGSGWEPELRIVVDTLLDPARLNGALADFYAEQGDLPGGGTAVRITGEVLTGTWEALSSGRADLAIGVGTAASSGDGLAARPLGEVRFVFAVSPRHPLARAPEPLPAERIQRHRAVAVGDTARTLPRFSTGLLTGQDVLTVPSMRAKLAAQVAGLGCGFLPEFAARPEVKAGRLVLKAVEATRAPVLTHYAWRAQGAGRALRWFLKRLEDPRLRRALLSGWG